MALGFAGIAYETLPVIRSRIVSSTEYDAVAKQVIDTAVRERASAIVVGIPLVSPGKSDIANWRHDSNQGSKCRKFAETVSAIVRDQGHKLQVFAVDESGSSKRARAHLGLGDDKRLGKGSVDPLAAQVIAQTYFEDPTQALAISPDGAIDHQQKKNRLRPLGRWVRTSITIRRTCFLSAPFLSSRSFFSSIVSVHVILCT